MEISEYRRDSYEATEALYGRQDVSLVSEKDFVQGQVNISQILQITFILNWTKIHKIEHFLAENT